MPKRWLTVACLLAILALAALLYLPGLGFYFVADDFRYLELAAKVDGPGDLFPHIEGACTRVGWPAVVLAFSIGRALGGVQPEAYRLLALAVHLINALLVYILARRALGAQSGTAALAAALVLALHPRQHESVMWLSTLTWSIGVLCALVAAICYVSWRQSGRSLWAAGAVAAVALAMVSNPSSIVLPAILAAYDVFRRDVKPSAVVLWLAMVGMVVLLGVVCGLGRLPTGGERASYGLGLNGIAHAAVFLAYIAWPVPLNLKELLAATPALGYLALGATLAAVGLAALAVLRRGNHLARWGVAWAAMAVLPPAFFSAFLSDHYMSLSLVGVALACAGIVHSLPARWARLAVIVAVIWTALAAPQVALKVRDWREASAVTVAVRDETLARHPQVAAGTRFFYIGLPEIRNRAVIWTYGIDSAVRLWYNDSTLRAVKDIQFSGASSPTPTDLVLNFSGRW